MDGMAKMPEAGRAGPLVAPDRQQQRLRMPRPERAEGRQNQVLALAELQLAAAEHHEPAAEVAAPRRRIEGRRVAALDAVDHRRRPEPPPDRRAPTPHRHGTDPQTPVQGTRMSTSWI